MIKKEILMMCKVWERLLSGPFCQFIWSESRTWYWVLCSHFLLFTHFSF